MKNKGIAKILSFILLFLLTGCGRNNEEIASEVSESELDIAVKSEPEELLDAFLAGEIPAIYDDREESAFMFDQLPFDEGEYETLREEISGW